MAKRVNVRERFHCMGLSSSITTFEYAHWYSHQSIPIAGAVQSLAAAILSGWEALQRLNAAICQTQNAEERRHHFWASKDLAIICGTNLINALSAGLINCFLINMGYLEISAKSEDLDSKEKGKEEEKTLSEVQGASASVATGNLELVQLESKNLGMVCLIGMIYNRNASGFGIINNSLISTKKMEIKDSKNPLNTVHFFQVNSSPFTLLAGIQVEFFIKDSKPTENDLKKIKAMIEALDEQKVVACSCPSAQAIILYAQRDRTNWADSRERYTLMPPKDFAQLLRDNENILPIIQSAACKDMTNWSKFFQDVFHPEGKYYEQYLKISNPLREFK